MAEERIAARSRLMDLVSAATGSVPEVLPDRETRLREGPPSQLHYESVVLALAYIRMRKVQEYGESRYRPESARYNLALNYGDLERKMLRLKHRIFSREPIDAETIQDRLMEDAADLANYGVMMVELCLILMEQGMGEDTDER